MILPDQRPAENTAQVEASFFNTPTQTSLLIKKLAQKIDSDIYIAAITRNLAHANYELTIKEMNSAEILKDDLTSANYMNNCIENFIQANYEQYQWAYRRFAKKYYRTASIQR